MGGGKIVESEAYQKFKAALFKEQKGEDKEIIIPLYKEIVEKFPESAEGRAANRGLVRLTGQSQLRPKTIYSERLFSFRGRISRTTFWADWVILVLPILLLMVYFDYVDGKGFFTGTFCLVILYPTLAVTAKRCHDRNRSGWFLLLGLIPLVNIWILIELGCLKGTSGDNKYGPDPLTVHYAI